MKLTFDILYFLTDEELQSVKDTNEDMDNRARASQVLFERNGARKRFPGKTDEQIKERIELDNIAFEEAQKPLSLTEIAVGLIVSTIIPRGF